MKILLVVPRTDLLKSLDEVEALIDSEHQIIPLMGSVSQKELLTKLQTNYDIIWFISHGSKEGILLSDGYLSSELLKTVLRGKTRLLYLNTCDSFEVARKLSGEYSVISWIGQVEDKTAYQTGVLFFQNLSRGFQKAYEYIRPNDDYIFLHGQSNMGETLSNELNELTKAIYELKSEMMLLKHRLATLEKRLEHSTEPISQNILFTFIGLIVLIALMIAYGLLTLNGAV